MDCQKYNELLAAYKHAVGLYMTAERNIQGLVWGDFQVAFKELEHLAQECMDATAAVLAHWRVDHESRAPIQPCP
jgi:hypothetical protein